MEARRPAASAPGTRLYADFVWRRAALAASAPGRVYTLTLYGGAPPRRLQCERGISFANFYVSSCQRMDSLPLQLYRRVCILV